MGTIHYVRNPNKKPLRAACGMSHPNMAWTPNLKSSSCPQCVREELDRRNPNK